jgi:ADP-heptose:LPS heptosyltransferase
MGLLKQTEIAFRQGLLRMLRMFVKRANPLPRELDFNSCTFLFVRQDRIGDVLVSTPLIHALKKHYPGATVDFLLSNNNHFVLEHEPLVRNRWIYRKNPQGAIETLITIRRQHYDFVIDLMDNPSTTSTVICLCSGGKWAVGLSKENAYAYDIAVPLLSRKETHIVDRLGRLLTVFGIEPDREEFRIRYATSKNSDLFAADFWGRSGLSGKFVIGMNVSPGKGVRFWGRRNYQELLRRLLAEKPGVKLLLLYQPADREEAASIAEPFPDVLLSPVTSSFDRFAALVRELSMLITPDTSAVHLAAAFNIPSVVLYVQSNKSLKIWEPYGSPSETLVTDVDDLSSIPPEQVLAAVRRLLQRTRLGHHEARNESTQVG